MRDAFGAYTSSGVTSVAGDSFRSVNADVTAMLRGSADQLAYGFIMRGWEVATALVGGTTLSDWPERPGGRPRGAGWTSVSFEDLFAPDAFEVQLLGPGYADRTPALAAWLSEPVGSSSVLLQHTDPALWFEGPFIPFGHYLRCGEQPPQPEVLVQARTDPAPILYAEGVLTDIGFADMDDA